MISCILARKTYVFKTQKQKDTNKESLQIFQTQTNGHVHDMALNDFRNIDANKVEFGKLDEKPAVGFVDDKN